MTLIERIQADTKDAMRAKDAATLGTLRFLSAQLQNARIEKREGPDAQLTDEEALRVLDREAKKRREAIALYTQGGRAELATHETQELEVILRYLPTQLTDEEVGTLIESAIQGGAAEFKDVMRIVAAETKGRADGSRVASLVKEHLAR